MIPHAEWLERLQAALEHSGADGQAAIRYIRSRQIQLRIRQQPGGARWTLWRRIEIHPRYLQDSPGAPYVMSLVVHEVRHLQQGPVSALSVYGELDAWRVQFNFLRQVRAEFPGTPAQRGALEQLLALTMDWDRGRLVTARQLMREYGGSRYRVDLLPLYPLPYELAYLLTGRPPV
ncbi:MAG TPA: hypothetical protein VLL49_00870 [Anaerolineales bacterium]|nr:hypothetical protein [Anaerolineales bacterium]